MIESACFNTGQSHVSLLLFLSAFVTSINTWNLIMDQWSQYAYRPTSHSYISRVQRKRDLLQISLMAIIFQSWHVLKLYRYTALHSVDCRIVVGNISFTIKIKLYLTRTWQATDVVFVWWCFYIVQVIGESIIWIIDSYFSRKQRFEVEMSSWWFCFFQTRIFHFSTHSDGLDSCGLLAVNSQKTRIGLFICVMEQKL